MCSRCDVRETTAVRSRGSTDELEIRVPADMSIVAICPEDQALDTHPAISNVSLPAAELGIVAVDQLLHLLEGKSPKPVVLPSTLTPRGSASRLDVPVRRQSSTSGRPSSR